MFKFNQKGFTLLELLVAIFVIVIGLIAAYKVASYPLSQVSVSMNRLTAAYLAQEGIEIVRNIRDTNWIQGENWKAGLDLGNWEADYNDQDLTLCPSPCDYDNNLRFLKINGGFYDYTGTADTKFKRKIIIDDSKMPDYLKITVEVFWEEKGKSYDFDLQENLYDYWGS